MKSSFKTTKQLAANIREASQALVWPDNYTIVDGGAPLKRCAAAIASEGAFTFDTETSGLAAWRDRVLGISIWASGEAFVLPVEHALIKNVPKNYIRKALGDAFADPLIKRSNHNIKFDMHFMEESLKIPCGPIDCDTLLQSLVLNPDNEQSHGLKELSAMYGLTSSYKGNYTGQFGKTAWSHIEPKLACYYAALDVDLARQLKAKQDGLLAEIPDLLSLFLEVEMPMLNLTYEMEKRGVRVDNEYVRKVLTPKVYTEWAKAMEALAPFIEPYVRIVGAESIQKVLESPTKLEKVFFDHLGVPEVKYVTLRNGPDGPFTKRTLDKDAIAGLQATCEPMKLLGEYRKWATVKKMFVDTLPMQIFDSRIHPNINPIGAGTGRMSMNSPNLQQIPSRMGPLVRNMFIPEPGFVFMSADFSSQEMRILAHYTKDEGLLAFFTNPKALDPYSETAIMVSKDDKTFDEVWFRSLSKEERKKTPMYRDFKALVLGLGFGMGHKKYARNTGKSEKEGKANYDKYHKAFPGVKRFQEAAAKFAKKAGYITTLLKRRRPLYDINNTADRGRQAKAERAACNTPIQGSAADMVKKAALACKALIDKYKWPIRIVLLVHDEIIFEMPIAWAQSNEKAIAKLRNAMETALPLIIPMKCSAEFETRWGSSISYDDLDDTMDAILDDAA